MKVQATEKLIAVFKRLEAKGLSSHDGVDYDAEIAELEREMQLGVCARCCFADCRCLQESPSRER